MCLASCEVERAILEGDFDGMREELVQVAAVALAWLEEEYRVPLQKAGEAFNRASP